MVKSYWCSLWCAPTDSVCRRRSLRPEEDEDARESTDGANLGMWKMRWKNGFFAESAECGEYCDGCCDARVADVAVRRDGHNKNTKVGTGKPGDNP